MPSLAEYSLRIIRIPYPPPHIQRDSLAKKQRSSDCCAHRTHGENGVGHHETFVLASCTAQSDAMREQQAKQARQTDLQIDILKYIALTNFGVGFTIFCIFL